MGISYDYMGYLSRETSDKNHKDHPKKNENGNKSKTKKKQRFHSTDINENPKLMDKFNTEGEKNQSRMEKLKEIKIIKYLNAFLMKNFKKLKNQIKSTILIQNITLFMKGKKHFQVIQN